MPVSDTEPRRGRRLPTRRRLRRYAGLGVLALAAPVLAACGSTEEGTPTLNWYINPDSGGQATIAERCSQESGGRYQLETFLLPRDSPSQREQLVRRLAANDESIDIMSLDTPYVPEFAQAGFLAPVPEDSAQVLLEDAVDPMVVNSTWRDELVGAPFWANTQLLWYRKSVAEAAGLDMTQPVTWQQLIDAAQQQDKILSVQGIRSESMTVWLNALVESAGGSIIENPEASPEDIELGLDDPPAQAAAEVMSSIAEAGVGGPVLSTANEDTNASEFESDQAGFMVNWPFVWARAQGKVEAGTLEQSALDDIGWALYPRVDENEPSAPPLGGIVLTVSQFSQNQDLAFEALECITSEDNQVEYMLTNGNPAARAGAYDRPEVLEQLPMAPVIRDSLDAAAPRPLTPYYSEVSGSIQREYHPPAAVQSGVTGPATAELIQAVLAKEELL